MKTRTIAVVLACAAALSACAVVPYSPAYDDYSVYPAYPPAVYYGPAVAPPVVIWGGWFGGRWHGHGHRHGGGHGGRGGWRR